MTQALRSSIKGALNSSIKGGFRAPSFRGSTLDLDFAGAKSLKNQVEKKDVVSFTRASSATYVDGDGVIKTTPVNLITYSEEFDQWEVASNSTVTPNTVTAPDGTLTADRVFSPATNSTYIAIGSITAGTTYTASVYAKAVTPGTNDTFTFNVGGSNGNASSQFTATDQWQRFTFTTTPSTVGAGSTNKLYINNQGDAFGSDIYFWGAQVEENSTATDYIPTTSTISGAPRFDHDPATGESLGLLIEEARTNYVANSDIAPGNAIGTAIISTTENILSPRGIVEPARKLERTPNQNNTWRIGAASVGAPDTTYAVSFWMKLESPGVTGLFVDINDRAPVSTNVGSQDTHTEWFKVKAIGGFRGDAPGHRFVDINLNSFNTGPVYIWGVQIEEGTFVTSYIPTEASALTRAADVAEITGNKFAKTNLLQYSERFDNATWIKQNTTSVTPNVAVAPDGTQTADLASFPGGGDRLYQSVSATGTVTLSCYVRSVSGSVNARMQIFNSTDGSLTKNFTATTEWQRVSFTTTLTVATSGFYPVGPVSGGEELYIWGAQLETGDELTEYTPSVESFVSRASSATYVDDTTGLIKTTPVNLILYSEQFNQTVWQKQGSPTIQTDAAVAPDGTQSAEIVSYQNVVVFQDQGTVTAGVTYTGSIYLKGNSNQTLKLRVASALGTDSQEISVTTEWQRFSVTHTAANSSDPLRLLIEGRNTFLNTPLPAGFELSMWGAQVEEGSTASPYIKTEATSSGAARYENGELILEEARTNIIDRNTTNWNSIWLNSIPTGAYNNAGIAPDGTNTAFATTAYGGFRGQKNYAMTADTNDYTFSIFIKSTGGQGIYQTFATGFNTGNTDSNGLTAYDFATDTVGHGYSRKLYANGWVRIWKTYANTNKTLFIVSNGIGTSLDMLFWGAQLEQGSYPSSLIITPDGADVTRAADVSTSALGVDSFYNQSEGTVFMEARCGGLGAAGAVTIASQFSDRTTANFFDVFRYQLLGKAAITSGGVNQVNFSTSTPINTFHKTAFGAKLDDFAVNVDGAASLTDNAGIMPVGINDLRIGDDATGSSRSLNGHIKRIAYFPTRLPNANLQNITS